jgi:hypothetical protein
MLVTRRELAAVVSAAAMAQAQTEQRTESPAGELQTARDRLKANSELLALQQVPMASEPAFQFKV